MEAKGTILLVEDNVDLNEVNRRVLEGMGYAVTVAETLADARCRLEEMEPDIILLDVMLPDGNGFGFCRELRPRTGAHIIYLTAKGADGEVLLGLTTGGDDYIRKPFHPPELFARIEAAMRRREMDRGKTPQTITRGPLSLDIVAAQAFLYGKDMLLSQKEFALLLLLVQNEGKALDKETAYRAVWGQPMGDDSNALYMAVSRLKKKLEPAADQGISLTSKRGEGYRFVFRRPEMER